MCRLLLFATLLSVVACGDSVEATSGTGGAGGEGGAGGQPMLEVGETCMVFCEKVIRECGAFLADEASCGQGCQQNLNDEYEQAEACGDAVDDVFRCVAALDSCQEVYNWRDQTPTGSFPCQPEIAVVDALIDGGICLPAP
jgi:hypothetical protein